MKRLLTNCTALVLGALLAVGCGDGGGKVEKKAKKQVITQKGSDTMVPLAQAWSEKFTGAHPDIQVQVTGGGSGTGISALINGTTDVCDASRPMKDEERQQIKQKYGSDVVEIPVAKDGITIYVHEGNKLDSLTIDQLRAIYLGQTKNWKELGGPDEPIVLYGRENSSGTYEFFKEHVLNKQDFAQGTQTLSGTGALVNAVVKDPNGIGYGGAAYSKGVKVLKIAGASGAAVEPSEANVLSGAYPLSRNLFLYLRQQPTGYTKTYVDWVLSPDGQAVVKQVGYFPIKGT
jgi:phosphate transport system substrate-binding protein